LVALVVLAFAVPAFAGLNPGVRAFISFNPACPSVTHPEYPYVHQIAFTSDGMVANAYFMLDCLGNTIPAPDPALLGARTVSFKWVVTASDPSYPPDALAAVYYPTDSSAIGGPDQSMWVIAWPDCWLATLCTYNGTKIMKVLKQGYIVHNPMTIQILPNQTDGKMVVDCLFGADQFCVLANGGVGMVPPPGDPNCTCPIPSPVESSTWGSIKALYR